jgi:hypothetical protein
VIVAGLFDDRWEWKGEETSERFEPNEGPISRHSNTTDVEFVAFEGDFAEVGWKGS